MSLLMQALKKAEHAKQKQAGSPSTEVAEEKNPLAVQSDDFSLSPKEAESPPSDSVNLDTSGLELSPVIRTNTAPAESESSAPESAFTPEQTSPHFDTSEPAKAAYTAPSRPTNLPENSTTENDRRFSSEALSQQMTAKMRLDQQKTAALDAGKVLAEQQKAKTVFASKQRNPNRRTIWLAVAGLIVVALFFGGGYYYLLMAPQNSTLLVKTLPIQSVPAQGVAPDATVSPAKETPIDAAIPQPTNAPKVAVQTAPAVAPKSTNDMPSKGAPEQVAMARKAPSAAGAEKIEIRQTTVDSHINPALSKAYLYFTNGDLSSAQQQYQTVLQQEPNNRDALLGMAAIALNRKQGAQAGSFYLKLLELDPSDPDAFAGITSLQGGEASDTESRLKKALTQNPQAGAILFALGNLYAQESRWSDAQQSYFRAFGTAPNNPDYAFNLAVSLDRLNQDKLALEFYQRALVLGQEKPGNLNAISIQQRIKQLQAVSGG